MCEKSGRWALALRRLRGQDDLPLIETRSLRECWEELSRHRRGLLLLELTPRNLDSLLAKMRGLGEAFPLARAAVVCEPEGAACQWLVREAGAVHFATTPRQAGELLTLARRYQQQYAAEETELDPLRVIWNRLPWLEGNVPT